MIHRQWFEPGATTREGEGEGSSLRLPLVLLHEGLGSISAWGSFPQGLADASGRRVLAYDRAGYGRSGPKPGPWPAEFMHHEAAGLAAVMASESLDRVVLVGHSDGATISLLYPSQAPAGSTEVAGIVSLSAHVMVEEVNVEAIETLRATYREGLDDALAHHHDDADTLFETWSDVWVSDRFRPWTIDEELATVSCPVLAVQGEADGYGTMTQIDRLVAAVSGPTERVGLAGVDHWPHKEARQEVLDLVTRFADRIDPG
ncbi:MAG: alpha/beta hydrolase [Actinomycetia bacterium]|nr:alpha/beta hydrolase [Actinomycetes bacterium]